MRRRSPSSRLFLQHCFSLRVYFIAESSLLVHEKSYRLMREEVDLIEGVRTNAIISLSHARFTRFHLYVFTSGSNLLRDPVLDNRR